MLVSGIKNLRTRYQGYSGARPDVVSLLPEKISSLLDVGCGAGMTGLLVKERNPQVSLFGVEPNSSLAKHAADNFDEVFQSKIDDAVTLEDLKPHAPFDVIICADVLEHLLEPPRVLENLKMLLSEGGVLVTSIPNIRHVSTFVNLGLLGTWPTRDRGIHDRTHLRFFARRDILALGHGAGLRLVRERRNLRLVESSPATMIPAKLLDFWPFRSFFTFQYLHVWTHGQQRTSRTESN